MSFRGRLRTNLAEESKAYGFTLVIWGSGAILMDQHGFPTVFQVMLYVLGAVLGFGLLAIAVYGSVFREFSGIREESIIVASTIHLLGALGTISLVILFGAVLDPGWAFFIAGLNATVTYNLLLLIEAVFSEGVSSRGWR